MAKLRRKAKARRDYTDAHIFQLLCGHDFFNDGFGTGQAAMNAMRRAWADDDVRERVYAMCAERHERGHERLIPWAAAEFGG